MSAMTAGHRFTSVLVATALVCLAPSTIPAQGAAAANAKALEAASTMVASSGASGGICAVVGSANADLALALARQGPFVVHALCAKPDLCSAMRSAIRSRGTYGTVSADVLEDGRLPYTGNLINLVVVDSCPALLKEARLSEEVLRVLAPLGTAYLRLPSDAAEAARWTERVSAALRSLGVKDISPFEAGGRWVRVRKPWPPDIDEWTHYLHGADGNPVAADRVVGPPRRYQWISGPLWLRSHETDSSVSTLVTARGRLFGIVDEAPISLVGQHPLPDKWSLVARDAFNGVLLWKVPIRRWGWRQWKDTWFNLRPGDIPLNIQKRLVAVGDKVYVTLGYQAPVSELDARTGNVLKTYAGTERTNEILHLNGTLILSVLSGDGVKVMAVDAASGRRTWVTEKVYQGTLTDYYRWRAMRGRVNPAKLDPTLNTATDGKVVALIHGPEIVALDFRTGKEVWRVAFPSDPADDGAGRIQSKGNLWVGTMIVSGGVVIHASPNKLAALAADSGQLLWSQPKKYIGHLWYEWKDVFVINGLVWTWSAELERGILEASGKARQRSLWPRSVNGYDLKTGEMTKQVPLGPIFKTHHHHRCYRNKATLRYILASRRGTEYVDLEHGKHTVHNWVRGTCHVGMMPANGLQYAPPHPCQCYIEEKINGMNALAPARASEDGRPNGAAADTRLQRGPAYGKVAGSPHGAAGPQDWPAFRHDSLRTGSVKTDVPADAAPLWRVTLGRKVSPPTIVAGRLFAALVDEHHVVCVDARDGVKQWEFAAGGRIDSPPTYHRGTVLFGSADGKVYCVRASDGELAWRLRAAPEPRLMGAFGQLESAWPVHGSVLVQNGTAYFAAGRSSQLDGGIYLYGVDASTGKLLHRTRLQGPDYTGDAIKENYKLPMGTLPDVLVGDGTGIYMRSNAFDAELKPQRGMPDLRTGSGFLEGSYFKRMPWTYAGKDYARLIVHDAQSAYYVRMFDSLRGLDPTVFFTPGKEGYLLFAKRRTGGGNVWSQRVPVRIRAMVVTAGPLFVAGPPDVVDPKDPLGAFEHRKGGLLYAVDTATGKRLASHRLPSPPLFDGAAAAQGRLYIAQEDGSITCFGKR